MICAITLEIIRMDTVEIKKISTSIDPFLKSKNEKDIN